MKQKLCLVGTSLINCLYAIELSKRYDVYLFEQGTLGGAWQSKPILGIQAQVFNNVICPLSLSEEDVMDEIYNYLSCLNIQVDISSNFTVTSDYLPRSCFFIQLNTFFMNLSQFQGIHIINTKVQSIDAGHGMININGINFNKVILPRNFYIPSFFGIEMLPSIQYKLSKSIHYRVCIENPTTNLRYSESFDNVFDRGGISQHGDRYLFTGRVRKSSKKLNQREIFESSQFLKENSQFVLISEVNSYNHTQVNEEYLNAIMSRYSYDNLHVVETRQFVNAYLNLRKQLALIH